MFVADRFNVPGVVETLRFDMGVRVVLMNTKHVWTSHLRSDVFLYPAIMALEVKRR
jgi:hypothetical protein